MTLRDALLGGAAEHLRGLDRGEWIESLLAASEAALAPGRHGHLPAWNAALAELPSLAASVQRLDAPCVSIGRERDASATERERLRAALGALRPWRKGPFELFGIDIDAEWRSDLKWARIAASDLDLRGAHVLDVGCGNGWYAWRMLGAGAASVLGVDPGLGHLAQFAAVARYAPDARVRLLPLAFEALQGLPRSAAFDAVFSMGVLYHRRSPLEHLEALGRMLRSGGRLVLETIVVAGDAQTVLCPPDRYARMRNVWFLPSTALATAWLEKLGFEDVCIVDEAPTTVAEQRPTEWMQFESLGHALDPADPMRTVEGHPAPRRAIILARRR